MSIEMIFGNVIGFVIVAMFTVAFEVFLIKIVIEAIMDHIPYKNEGRTMLDHYYDL